MTNQEIYELLNNIDKGYEATPGDIMQLSHINFLKWEKITFIPKSMGLLSGLEELDLSESYVKDIEPLSSLESLLQLNLSGTWVSDIRALSSLTKLYNLDMSLTKVSDISVVAGLGGLSYLNLADNWQLTDIRALLGLSNLRTLNLKGTRVRDISALSSLVSLENLYLNNTEVNDIHALAGLNSLTDLDLSKTEVKEIQILSELKRLKKLNLCALEVSNISVLSELKALTYVNLSRTNVSDISALSVLENLENLNLSWNKNLSDISVLSSLNSIKILDLRNLTFSSLPESLLELNLKFITEKEPTGSGIYIYGLKLTEQPIELLSQNKDLIRAYYREHSKVPVNECKVIFLGDAEAGKTHSIKRLLKNGEYLTDFDGNSTPGIEISSGIINLGGENITVNYWDFGGQEIQHSMHRMFLTERTVYVIFLNARQDPLDERAKYWMENIVSFAPDAPVLFVINKIDQNERPKFNVDGIFNEYGNEIKKVVRMSALNDKPELFMDKLQGSINEIIDGLSTVRKKIPKSWKTLMEDIRIMPKQYLTTSEFKEKCATCNVNDYEEIHDDLVDLFQVIGISFCYYKNRSTADYILLNPRWIVNAIYMIITNSKMVANNGIITQEKLYNLLVRAEVDGRKARKVDPIISYEGTEVNYILGVIRMFRLSYSLGGKESSEFFPMLCDGNEKVFAEKVVSQNTLHFIFAYRYLPSNVLHRLIVEMHVYLDYQNVWFSGAVLRNYERNQYAYIRKEGNELHIYVDGRDPLYNPNEFLMPICDNIRVINAEMGLTYDEYLTYRMDGKEERFLYEWLVRSIKKGLPNVYSMTFDQVLYINEILGRYDVNRTSQQGVLHKTIIDALIKLQDNKTFYSSSENERNTYIRDLMDTAGYICKDQTLRAISASGKSAGELDIRIEDKDGNLLSIYEGLNLKGFSKSSEEYLDKHLEKLLDNYNSSGCSYLFLVSYVECKKDKFSGLILKYEKHIQEVYMDMFKPIGQLEHVKMDGFLRCMKLTYKCGKISISVYHVIVRMGGEN